MDYTTLPLASLLSGLDAAAADTRATFGALDARQLKWRPDAAKWSVAQCLEHLLAANGLLLRAAHEALDGTRPRTIWQRLPLAPTLFGPVLIRSQAPGATRKFTASPLATPAASDVDPDVVRRFVDQSGEIRRSLDGVRLMVAHDRRHIEQARRARQSPGVPRCSR